MNRGFADLRVEPLHHVARCACRQAPVAVAGCPSRIRTSVHGSKVRCPTTRRRGSGPENGGIGAEDGTRTRDPHLGKVMLYQLSHFRSEIRPPDRWCREPDRTGDTAIFSRVLYQLSYLGPMANQPSAARRRVEGYHGPRAERQFRDRGPTPLVQAGQRAPRRTASSGGSPVSSRSRLIRSRIGGWVDISPDERASNFLIGLVKYMCCVPRLATSRTSWSPPILASARSRP